MPAIAWVHGGEVQLIPQDALEMLDQLPLLGDAAVVLQGQDHGEAASGGGQISGDTLPVGLTRPVR